MQVFSYFPNSKGENLVRNVSAVSESGLMMWYFWVHSHRCSFHVPCSRFMSFLCVQFVFPSLHKYLVIMSLCQHSIFLRWGFGTSWAIVIVNPTWIVFLSSFNLDKLSPLWKRHKQRKRCISIDTQDQLFTFDNRIFGGFHNWVSSF